MEKCRRLEDGLVESIVEVPSETQLLTFKLKDPNGELIIAADGSLHKNSFLAKELRAE